MIGRMPHHVEAPSRPGRAWAWVLPGLAVAAACVSALLLFTPAGDPLDPDTLAANLPPEGGRDVVVRATVMETTGIPDTAPDGTLLARGGGGSVLLVIPREGAEVQQAPRGAAVTITGHARTPRDVADGRLMESPPLTATELVGRTGADVVITADEVTRR
jgi:hypothetical protein